MGRRTLPWVVVVLAGIAGVAVWTSGGGPRIEDGPPPELRANAAPADAASATEQTSEPKAPRPMEDSQRTDARRVWSLRGRVVDRNGAPVANAQIYGTVDDAESAQLNTRTRDDGEFAVKGDAPPECCLRVEVDAEGFAREWWKLYDLQLVERSVSGVDTDLGDLTLTRSGTIAGRLVDAEGAALARSFGIVCRDESHGSPLGARSASSSFGRIDAATHPLTGEFRLERVPEGLRTLYLRWPNAEGAREERKESIVVKPGETRHTTIATTLSKRCDLLFVKFELPPGLKRVSHEHVGLAGSDGVVHRAFVHDSNHWVFARLSDDDYTLSVDDPLLLPVQRSRLRPSDEPVVVKLELGAFVALDVVDAATGQRIAEATVSLGCTDASDERWSYTIHPVPAPNTEGVFDGVPSGNVAWIAGFVGYLPSTGVVNGLTRGEKRPLTIRLEKDVETPKVRAPVKGVVLSPAGARHVNPVAVELVRADSLTLEMPLLPTPDSEWTLLGRTFTESGAFAFVAREPGVYKVLAYGGWGSTAQSRLFRVADSTPIDVSTLTLPTERAVRGTLTLPKGYEAEGSSLQVTIHATNTGPEPSEAHGFHALMSGRAVDAGPGGAFEVKGLSDGEYDLLLTQVRRAGERVPTALTFGPLALGSVKVQRADVEGLRLAVRPEALTMVDLEVRAGGVPLPFAALQVSAVDDGRVQWMTCDDKGAATLGPIPAGAIDVFVHGLEGGWRFRGENSYPCVGPRTTVTIDIPMTTCVWTLVESNKPRLSGTLVNVYGEFGPGSPHCFDFFRQTGAAGELVLRLPAVPGRVRIFHTAGQAQIDFDTVPPAEATLVVK